jgi:capsule polysaccharide export protein KpsE/RkpR
MDKARAHLEALDDIETARATLITARQNSRRLTGVMLAIFVGLPTLLTAVYYQFIAAPVFQSTSILAIESAVPATPRNPLFNNVSAGQNTMAAAFQLRAQMQAQTDQTFVMAIDATQGLLTISTSALTPTLAYSQIAGLIKTADTLAFPARLKVLAQPDIPEHAKFRVLPNTLLAFLVSLSLFTISAIFFQSFRHYARN